MSNTKSPPIAEPELLEVPALEQQFLGAFRASNAESGVNVEFTDNPVRPDLYHVRLTIVKKEPILAIPGIGAVGVQVLEDGSFVFDMITYASKPDA